MINYKGFTLTEFLITTSMAAIALAIAVPSYTAFIDRAQVTTVSNSFIAAIHLARSEAIKRGAIVTMCAAADASQTQCGTSADWKNGWIVFSDPNGAGQPPDAASIIQKFQATSGQHTITAGVGAIGFDSAGAVAGNVPDDLIIGPSQCESSYANPRRLNISRTGHLSSNTESCNSQSNGSN